MMDISIDIPEYIGKGIIELLILTVGGLLVGWITHTYFARKAAIAEVEGEVMKKRLAIYEELYKRLNSLLAQEILPSGYTDKAIGLLRESGFERVGQASLPTLTMLHSAKSFTDAYMELDTFISNNRLYYETEVDKTLLLFTNYFAIYRRLQVMFEVQIIDRGLSLEDSNIANAEDLLMAQTSILYQDELASEVMQVLEVLKASINNPERHRRKAQDHSIATFGDNGAVLDYLDKLRIFQEREQIQLLIAQNIALAIASNNVKGRK